jgi:uncharacterized protein with PQ loop repeat
MESVIGYSAAGVSIVAFGSQFYHTVRSGTVKGLSINRSILDTLSLLLWVAYATRIDDIPLLIATSCELVMSLSICVAILSHCRGSAQILPLKNSTPDPSPPSTPPNSPKFDIDMPQIVIVTRV